MAKHLNWGILGTGNIANKFAKSVAQSAKGTVVSVGSRSQETADKFAARHKIAHAYSSYEAVLEDPSVDIVYISVPHPFHAEWAVKTARAGKHILCEKPMGLNAAEAMGIQEEAHHSRVFLMEAYMYRCHPLITRLIQLLRQEVIGEIKTMRMDFSFDSPLDPHSRLYDKNLAGGGILDVGGYPVSLARMIAGVSMGKPFANPVEVQGMGHLGKTGIDEYALANLKFQNGMCAQISCAVRNEREWDVALYGSMGSMVFRNPWLQAPNHSPAQIRVSRKGSKDEVEEIPFDRLIWSYEVDKVADCIDNPEALFPAFSWEDTLGNLQTMDAWRSDIGLVYPPERHRPPLSGKSLQPGRLEQLPTASFPGSGKMVSRLVMGVDNQTSLSHASVMFDDFIERGGTAFDTAWIYHGGFNEDLWGKWQKNRGIREDLFLIGKGAHSPHCNPESLIRQLKASLKRLKTDYLDLYFLHRDNPEVAVDEFVDVLNQLKKQGRIRAFGGSNWSLERVDAANAYARTQGLEGFTAISNQFSLAEMIKPVWPGCVSASDAASRQWFENSQTTLFSWSSQARGFFTERADPEKSEDKELVRCWYSEENFQRRIRAEQCAREKGTSPLNIALAYVLNQPFPTFSLIGPRMLQETRTATPGAYIHLTRDELSWLNLES